MQLNQLIDQIDQAFGEELPFSGRTLSDADLEALQRVFGDAGYQGYLQDQVNRQIIRDYVVNAVLLGFVSEPQLERLSTQVASREGRAALSLNMLMSSVEQAGELLAQGVSEPLEPLKPEPSSPPHIRLIQS